MTPEVIINEPSRAEVLADATGLDRADVAVGLIVAGIADHALPLSDRLQVDDAKEAKRRETARLNREALK